MNLDEDDANNKDGEEKLIELYDARRRLLRLGLVDLERTELCEIGFDDEDNDEKEELIPNLVVAGECNALWIEVWNPLLKNVLVIVRGVTNAVALILVQKLMVERKVAIIGGKKGKCWLVLLFPLCFQLRCLVVEDLVVTVDIDELTIGMKLMVMFVA